MPVVNRFPTPDEIQASARTHPVPFDPNNPSGVVGSLWYLRYRQGRYRAVVLSTHQRDSSWILTWNYNRTEGGFIVPFENAEDVVYARSMDPMTGDPTD